MKLADLEKARRAARKLLERHAVARPPVDPEKIAKREQLHVFYVTFSGPSGEQISGYIEPKARKIVVNASEPPERKTYAIAHELGHFLLHREYIQSTAYRVLPRPGQPDAVEKKLPEQLEADAFAAELLVPIRMLMSYRSLVPPDELAAVFVVPPQLIMDRLSQAAA